jgi:hypothetical protein
LRCAPGRSIVTGRGEKKLLLKNEGRILSSARSMRKRALRGCGAKPTRHKSETGCESKREALPYSIQAHRASELMAVSTDTFQEPFLSRSLQ